jgi:alpha/beta superfamily hydrolase
VLAWIAKQHPSLPKPTLVGWSRGAAMSGMVAVATPGCCPIWCFLVSAFDPDLSFAELDESELKPTWRRTRERQPPATSFRRR